MSTVAELRIPADDTVLANTLEYVPGLSCDVEQVIVADQFGLWFGGADYSTVETALSADQTVERFRYMATEEERHLFSVEFTDAGVNPFSAVVEAGGAVLAASIDDAIWTLRLRVHERESVSEIYEHIEAHGPHVDIVRLCALSHSTAESFGLTEEQYSAIVEAIEHGYFEIPRQISLEELAAELGISHQALSERLRRAYQTLAAKELETADRERIERIETEA